MNNVKYKDLTHAKEHLFVLENCMWCDDEQDEIRRQGLIFAAKEYIKEHEEKS